MQELGFNLPRCPTRSTGWRRSPSGAGRGLQAGLHRAWPGRRRGGHGVHDHGPHRRARRGDQAARQLRRVGRRSQDASRDRLDPAGRVAAHRVSETAGSSASSSASRDARRRRRQRLEATYEELDGLYYGPRFTSTSRRRAIEGESHVVPRTEDVRRLVVRHRFAVLFAVLLATLFLARGHHAPARRGRPRPPAAAGPSLHPDAQRRAPHLRRPEPRRDRALPARR